MDRAEATGFGVAAVGHVALLAALTLGLATASNPPIGSNPIEISFVEEVGLVSSAPEPPMPAAASQAPEAGPPEQAAPAPAAPAPPAESPPPRPAQERVAERPKQTQQRQRQNPPATGSRERNRGVPLSELFKDGFGSDRAAPARPQRPAATVTGEARASINAAIRSALLPCERQPLPSPEAAAMEVDVRVTLNRDGGLAEANVLRVRNSNPEIQMYERRMRDLALNVIRQCTPIRGLPGELYDVPRGWRRFTYTFDPRQS